MTNHQSTNNNNISISEKRRKLLKASATAPLLTTLTFSTQRANASAFQCMAGDIPSQGYITTADTDKDVRVSAERYTQQDNPDIYRITGLDPILWYDLNGNALGSDSANPPLTTPKYSLKDSGHVLAMYKWSNTGTPTDGVILPFSKTWPQYQSNADYTPLYESCVTSLVDMNIHSLKGNIV